MSCLFNNFGLSYNNYTAFRKNIGAYKSNVNTQNKCSRTKTVHFIGGGNIKQDKIRQKWIPIVKLTLCWVRGEQQRDFGRCSVCVYFF